MPQTVTALFTDQAHAESALALLREAGVEDSRITVVAQGGEGTNAAGAKPDSAPARTETDGRQVTATTTAPDATGNGDIGRDNTSGGLALGGAVGGTAGLLTGLGLMALPGMGPLVAAGWLTTLIFGAAGGAALGGLAGALADAGVEGQDATSLARAVSAGQVLIAVRAEDALLEPTIAALEQAEPLELAEAGAQTAAAKASDGVLARAGRGVGEALQAVTAPLGAGIDEATETIAEEPGRPERPNLGPAGYSKLEVPDAAASGTAEGGTGLPESGGESRDTASDPAPRRRRVGVYARA